MFHLRVEPRTVAVHADSSHFERTVQALTFWQVWADDYLLSDDAEPFTANDSTLILHQCETCGYCGLHGVSVRRVCKQVVWFGVHDSPYQEVIFREQHLVPIAMTFDSQQYIEALSKGDLDLLPEMIPLDLQVLTQRLQDLIAHRSHRSWDKNAIYLFWPQGNEAFQRTPHCEADFTGVDALHRIERGVLGIKDSLQLRAEPAAWTELRIRITLPDFPEAVWRVGETPDGLAFCFLAFPLFPLWCGHPLLDVEFGDYFRQTLRP